MTHWLVNSWCGSDRAGARVSFVASVLLGAVLFLGGLGSYAWAAEPADVEHLIRRGVELRHRGQDQAALPLFQRAYDLDQTPRTAAQLGLAEAALGYWLAAEKHLEQALASGHHPWIDRNRPLIQQTLKDVQSAIGEVEITGSPAGAEVVVNGRPVGRLPLPTSIRVVDGVANVSVKAAGYSENLSAVKVAGGRKAQVSIVLARLAPPIAAPKRAKRPAASLANAPIGSPTTNEDAAAPAWVRPASWVVAGLAAAGAGVALYGFGNMWRYQGQFDDKTINGIKVCDTKLDGRGPAPCGELYKQGLDSQRLALIGAQAGALLAVTALVGFLWSSSGAEPDRVAFDTDGSTLSLRTRF